MADAFGESTWQGKLLTIFRVFSGGELALALRNILETWILLEQPRDRISYHGMYEILDYPSTLEITDAKSNGPHFSRKTVSKRKNRPKRDRFCSVH